MLTPEPPPTSARVRSPLVGREPELSALRELVRAVTTGAHRALLLAGESGMGKTRLLEELLPIARDAGCLAVTGRAFPAEGAFPFAIVADALSALVKTLGPAAVAVLARGAEHELGLILPTLSAPPRTSDRPNAEGKARVFWHVAQFLQRAAAQRPVIVALDNAQWADESSLELMHFLLRQLGGSRVGVIIAYNPHDRTPAPALRAIERSLTRAGLAVARTLGPLDREDVSRMVRHALPDAGPLHEPLTDRLLARTQGNPFFVEEMLKAVERTGVASGSANADAMLSALTLPASVRDGVLARADALEEGPRRVLDLVAVVGRRAPARLLQPLTGLDAPAFLDTTSLLIARRLLAESEVDGDLWFECDHPLVQASIYDALGRARAQGMHRMVAEAYERLHDACPGTFLNDLAWHYARSGLHAASPRALAILGAAGRDALARYANREAASFFQQALGAADAGDAAARRDVIDGLARAQQRLGEYDAAYALWSQARAEAERASDLAMVARAERRMGLSAFWSGRSRDAIAHYTAAILTGRSLGDDAGVVQALVARATALRAVGEPAEAQDSLREACEIAERCGDEGLLARVHRALLLAYAWTGPADRARYHAHRALEYALAVDEPAVAWSAHWAMAVLAGFTGDGKLIAEHLEAAQRIASETGSPVLEVWTGEIAIEHASAVGDWHKGLEVAERVLPQARAVASRTVLPRILVWKGLILLAQDRLGEANACFDEAWERANADSAGRHVDDVHVLIPAHLGRAAYALATGDFAGAIRLGEHGLALADHYGYRAWSIHRLLPVVLEARIWNKDFDGAERDSARLRADAILLDHRLGVAWADAADALTLRFRDQSPHASQAMLAAADELDRVPFVFHAARLRRNAAQLLAAEGARDAALAILRQIHTVFQQLGAERELRFTRDAIRNLGARPPVRASISAGVLTSREQEIARLIAQRMTNKEVGAALDISARTVGTHLSNIFEKLGLDSRGALVDLVRAEPSLVETAPADTL